MGRLVQEKQNNDDRLMVFRVGNDEVKLSNNLVKRYLVSGQGNVTDQEIMYFMKLCKARNLNPFVKQVFLNLLVKACLQVLLLRPFLKIS